MQNTKLVTLLVAVVAQTVGGEMCSPIETSRIGKMGRGQKQPPILTALLLRPNCSLLGEHYLICNWTPYGKFCPNTEIYVVNWCSNIKV